MVGVSSTVVASLQTNVLRHAFWVHKAAWVNTGSHCESCNAAPLRPAEFESESVYTLTESDLLSLP